MRKDKEQAKAEKKLEKMAQKEMQKQFNMFKKRFKMRSKSELVAILWTQGIEFRKLQEIAQELYEENKELKAESQDQKEVKNEESI